MMGRMRAGGRTSQCLGRIKPTHLAFFSCPFHPPNSFSLRHPHVDVTRFVDIHPGGKKILLRYCGKDATEQFQKYHAPTVLSGIAQKYKVGTVDSVLGDVVKKEGVVQGKKKSPLLTGELEVFGDLAPFCEPYW